MFRLYFFLPKKYLILKLKALVRLVKCHSALPTFQKSTFPVFSKVHLSDSDLRNATKLFHSFVPLVFCGRRHRISIFSLGDIRDRKKRRGNCGVETDNAFPGIFAAKNVSSTVFPVYASFFILISFRGENKKRFGKRGKKGRVKGIPRFSVDQTNRVGLCVHLSLAQTIPFYDVEERPAR